MDEIKNEFRKIAFQWGLERIKRFCGEINEEKDLGNKLRKYLDNFYENNREMNTIVFEGVKKDVVDLYVPIKIRATGDDGKIYNMNHAECLSVFGEYRKVLIVDTAGMGKSTLVKYMSLNIYEKYISDTICEENKDNLPIPVVIQLRKLDDARNLINAIRKELNLISTSFSEESVRKMLEEGEFLLFLDGFDELDENLKGDFVDAICELADKARESIFVMTSRNEEILAGFRGFQKFNIEPLSKETAYELIRKYDQNGEVSKELIPALENDSRMHDLKEFLSNPLLTSLLYMAYKYRNIIPNRKHLFYEQVYEALFQGHDQTKGGGFVHPKNSLLDKEKFQKVLNRIAFLCVSKSKLSMKEAEFNEIIQKAVEFLPIGTTTIEGMKKDLLETVPLIRKDGLDYLWVHKSFAEYFAACFVVKDSDKKIELLRKMAFGEKYYVFHNVFDFCFDMDEGSVREYVIKVILEDFIKHYETSYKSDIFEDMSLDLINKRKTLDFLYCIRYVDKTYKIDHKELRGSNYNGFPWTGISQYAGQKNKILYYRKEYTNMVRMLIEREIDVFSQECEFDLSAVSDYKEINKLGDFNEFILSDEVENICNKKGVFIECTELAFMTKMHDIRYIDYEKCRNLLSNINREIEAKKDDDFDI